MSATWVTLGVLLAGVLTVIGGILVLRLHAFLALILAALVVNGLTSSADIQRYRLLQDHYQILTTDAEQSEVTLADSKQRLREGTLLLVTRFDAETGHWSELGTLQLASVERSDERAKSSLAKAELLPPLDAAGVSADDLIVTPETFAAARRLAGQTIADRVADAFGNTVGSIGLLIAMASIIGKCLLDSGAADKIVRRTLGAVGESRAPVAFLGSGFLLGIPVFFDTVFYLMIPLAKALRVRTGRNYLVYVLTIVAGATMAHSLVPPTPGPLFVAEQLGVSVGMMMLGGMIVGACASLSGYVFAVICNRRTELPLRETPDCALADLEEIVQRDERDLPPLWLALLPILLPVVLIGGATIFEPYLGSLSPPIVRMIETLGDKNIALVLAAAIAMLMLVVQKRVSREELARSVQAALSSGGVIILITAAGGAFGESLKQTGVAGLVGQLATGEPLFVVLMAFLVTAAVRTAQGSATVAMITAVGILSGIAADLPFHPVYLALAIGCGSKPCSWMNDSGFWVVTRMSGMTEREGLRYVTVITGLMGVTGLLVTLLGVALWPHPLG